MITELLPTVHTDTDFNFIDNNGGTHTVGRGNGIENEADALNALLSGFKAERITQIKAIAQEQIYAIVPPWRQANLTARSVQLLSYKITRGLTTDETEEYARNEAIWGQVQEIRAASDEAELAVNAATTVEEINAVYF